jgi:uncharacterized cupin superfamily protein
MSDDRHPNVIHLDDVPAMSREKGSKFGFSAKQLGEPTGAEQIGCNWFEVPPGRTAFPCHYHCAMEETVFILEGEGTARIGKDEVPVRAGHYLSYPVGPDHAHQLINTGSGPLRYLCFSTKATAEVVGYPDSNKVGAMGARRGAPFGDRWVGSWFPADAGVDYYEGEETGE